MRSRLAVLVSCAALTLVGCSAPDGGPEVTFFADGEAVESGPLVHCDVLIRRCEQGGDPAKLRARAGRPVQISVPSEVSDAPWVVNVQYADANGEPRPVKQEFFSPGTRHAYTATGDAPGDQLLVVEVQQLGAAYAADEDVNPLLDAAGNPQLVARAVWSLQLIPGA
ncbi:Protein of unknown function [Amycolatopsis marina]|uniref:DUF2771 domain-containing protein n=1 Tax=Amycolatopsis marina TaxID=490629 RepID=A0A1I1CHU6_9PSEU|nr:DUF2771 family protein [Amycolatopsis marina]SFB62261.1 Protein of unknown function [Amycolatopsis marina]